jgi:hypothetical protein
LFVNCIFILRIANTFVTSYAMKYSEIFFVISEIFGLHPPPPPPPPPTIHASYGPESHCIFQVVASLPNKSFGITRVGYLHWHKLFKGLDCPWPSIKKRPSKFKSSCPQDGWKAAGAKLEGGCGGGGDTPPKARLAGQIIWIGRAMKYFK